MKIGDKVRCIDNRVTDKGILMHALTIGNTYEVLGADDVYITVKNDQGNSCDYYSSRFELVDKEVESMNNEFIVGDKALCIDALDADYITEGKIYEVLEVDENSITIEDDRRILNPFIKNRFNPIEHIKTFEEQTIIDANSELILPTAVDDMQGCANVADAITEDVQVINFKPVVNVLGTEYTVEIVSEEDDAYLNGIYGYCDFLTKSIVLKDLDLQGYQGNIDALNAQYKVNLRHELIHAFLYESGLDSSTLDGWARNEEMIDYMALQLPKIAKLMQECKIL